MSEPHIHPQKTAFVTGGTGFVGSHLVEELLRRGYVVRALIRTEPKWLEGMDVVPVYGDMHTASALELGCRDVDFIYHVAGVTRSLLWDDFLKGNVTSVKNLLDVVLQVCPHVKKVAVISSLAAVGPSTDGPLTETSALNPISAYGRSKAEMERLVSSYTDRLPIVVLRPTAVYGPRESDIFTFFQTVNRGFCPIVGKGDKKQVSLVHVDDVVRGIVDAAESPHTAGKTYILGSEICYSWNEIRAATLAAIGRRALTVRIPEGLVGAVGAASELVGRLLGIYPALNREKAREIRAEWVCSINNGKHDFGYAPQVGLEDGIRRTIEWYRREGWL